MSITLSWVLGAKDGAYIYQDILEEKLEIAREFILGIKTMDIIKPEVVDDIIESIK